MTLTPEQVERVRSLETENGQITPDRVIEDARSKSSPLHDLFEWDKSKAAMLHWIDQAREIIGAVRVVVTTTTSTVKAPLYVRDPEASGQGYRSVTALRADPEQARASLVYTLEVAAGHVRRACDLAEPLGLSSDIDGLLEQIVGVQRAIKAAA